MERSPGSVVAGIGMDIGPGCHEQNLNLEARARIVPTFDRDARLFDDENGLERLDLTMD